MKNILLFALLITSVAVYGQIEIPAASPFAKVEQAVGLSTFTVEYSRPSVKGRTIFAEDGLVPLGKIWRTGANRATKISFSDDVSIDGNELAAGDYVILTTPGASNWAVHFYTFETPWFGDYVEKTPALTVNTGAKKMNKMVETFTISFQNLAMNSCTLNFYWEKTGVSLPVSVDVDSKVMASIEKTMSGPTTGDFYSAATYYHTSGKDLDQALKYITMATDVEEPKFWQVRRKALILADMDRKKEAIEAAKMSKELAMKAGNDDYVRMNEKSIAKWSGK